MAKLDIKPKLQKYDYDCGQTCLEMLGYSGHKMFPNREVQTSDLRSIPGAQEVTVPVGQEETLDYSIPHVWILLGKGSVAGVIHWVIRYKNRIYCPTLGEMNAQKYKQKYVAYILQEIIVPFKNQATPSTHDLPPNRCGDKALTTEEDSKRDFKPVEGDIYLFEHRKVKYLGESILSNGIRQFQVEYLDDPKQDRWPSEKQGKTAWHGDWQLIRLKPFHK